ncbi:hypothetical protein ACFX5Q_23470 [Mesorhizobium sp. IMUNJ 23033]|uniref:hypothetical protein n=1 Tax=Mesorhizobium sp. IMUNJ 23033 TaxID=3378039 RepID=UPI00384E431E
MSTFDRSYSDARLLLARAVRNGVAVPQPLLDQLVALSGKGADVTLGDELKFESSIGELMRINKFASESNLSALRSEERRRAFYERMRLPSAAAALSIFSFLLILLIIRITTDFNKLTLAVSDIKEATSSDYFDGIENTRVLLESAIDQKGNWQLTPEARNALKTARDLDGRLVASVSSINEFCLYSQQGRNWWSWVVSDLNSLCSTTVQQAEPQSPAESAIPSEVADPNVTSSWRTSTEMALPSAMAVVATLTEAEEVAVAPPPPAQPPPTTSSQQYAPPQATAARRMMDNISDFANTLGLTFNSAETNTSLYRIWRWAENTKSILGGSILPLLYGILGSAVYLLRTRFSSDQAKTMQLSQAGGAFLRLGLGGISGLAIGWFWTPTGADGVERVANLTPTPFAIAFLAGYSIDLLFSILDRLISAINPRPERPIEGQSSVRPNP